jgi:putative ABC transport system ATP-binding protein/lipoprotein-releasing system ATP-binding protein
VLDGASFTIERGRSAAILGPSGSGKSTLLSVLGGLVRPDDGTVRVDLGPQATDGASVALRDVTAWVLQTTNVLPERSALENVVVAALTQHGDRRRARAEAERRLESVGLADRAHDSARVLSGGELQRVVIARALASGRPFLLADEPTGQLDRATSMMVLDALLRSSGDAGVVIVTHDPAVAARCDVTARLEDGRVVAA